MNIFDAFILSIVEGITEFLPISSTAHLILTSHILGIKPSEFLSTFEVVIQLGAIGAVIVLYFNRIRSQISILYKASLAFIPTGVIGFFLYDRIKLLFNDPLVPVVTLFVGGIVVILLELFVFKKASNNGTNLNNLSYKNAFLIGLIQSISMIPGVSRAASSIFGGLALGMNRKDAVEFSFLLAIPTMLVATLFDLVQSSRGFTESQFGLLGFGVLLSFISALFVIRWLIRYIQTNNFIFFGIYRIVVSILYYFLFLR